MSDDLSLGHQITLQLMPILMILGAVMSLGANFWLPPLLLIGLCAALVIYWFYTMKNLHFEWKDLRFVILPILVMSISFLTYYHLMPAFYDQAYHMQISNRIIDRWDWEPVHQGMDYSFRPEIISGIAAIELWLTGESSIIYVVPTLLLISTTWSIQHAGEHFSNPKWGFISGVVFCLLPVTIMYGRTMLLDVAVAGMIVSVFHHLHLSSNTNRYTLIMIGILSAIIGLTKYSYLYLGGWISILYFIRKKKEESKYIAFGYFAIITLFLLKNQIHTGWILGPLQSQLSGTFASGSAIAADSVTYSPRVFLTEFVEQWHIVLICIGLYGNVLIAKRQSEYIFNFWLLILPAVILHGYVLDFGWPRYSTPWFALFCIGLPAAIVHSNDEFGEQIRQWKIPSILIGILILTFLGPMLQTIEDMESRSESMYDERENWSNIYRDVGSELDGKMTIVTGKDITMGLYSHTPCFRYEDPEYSMLQAINKFEATHVFTQDLQYRYDIDVNSTFLYGSPIEPVKVFSSNKYIGRLWGVDQSRLAQSDWWRNSTIEINGSGAHYGDFIWLENGSKFDLLEHTAIRQIYETKSKIVLGEIFDVLSQTRQNLLCDSVESCSDVNRSDHLEMNWAVWMVKDV
ncbi:MAG: hypothetical protein NLN64_05970 [Candidatus Thalassarchaeaceae archaeon]|nr:hypothetical protein [Candidatus Thalassarchaeaceae archaeon]